MEFKLFGIKLIIRILLIVAVSFLMASIVFLIPETKIVAIPIILAVILMYQIWELNRYVNLTNRELTRFIQAFRSRDYSAKFYNKKLNKSFNLLLNELQGFMEDLMKLQHQKIAENYYRDEIVKHLTAGLITINETGEVVIANKPALQLIGKLSLKHYTDIEDANPLIANEIRALLPKGEKLVEVAVNDYKQQMLISVSTIIALKKKFVIISFQDIGKEMDNKEVNSWIKLIRVIRHEIMNSVTPISSMSETAAMIVENSDGGTKLATELNNEDVADLHSSIRTILQRTEGLHRFVDKYWDISRIPRMKIGEFKVSELVDPVFKFMQSNACQQSIEMIVEYNDADRVISADKTLIEQVIINLIKNSIEALSGSSGGKIVIKEYYQDGKSIIEVKDNGPGISPEQIDEVFVPFYTTKENGSGIGLSLSKQIMNLHGGSLSVCSTPGIETSFKMVF